MQQSERERNRGGRPEGRRTVVTSQRVLSVIVERASNNPPLPTSRTTVAKELGVPWKLVDEHVERLIEDRKIEQVSVGFYLPVDLREDRAVSVTAVHGGNYKVEVGDGLLEVNRREFIKIAELGAGLLHSGKPPK